MRGLALSAWPLRPRTGSPDHTDPGVIPCGPRDTTPRFGTAFIPRLSCYLTWPKPVHASWFYELTKIIPGLGLFTSLYRTYVMVRLPAMLRAQIG
jgi:hypothetical protein